MRAASTAWLLALGLALAGDVRAQDGVAPDVHAQEDATRLATGFTPDPVRLSGRTGGLVPLSERAPGCRGYVGSSPNHVLEIGAEIGFLRLFVTSREHVTFAVHGPDGGWSCSGRPLLGAPREEGRFGPGRYELWVGSALPGGQISYEVSITEFHSVTPATGRSIEGPAITSGADLGLEIGAEAGRFRDRNFPRGFLPDPRVDEGRAGGSIRVGVLGGGCRGRVEAQPNHVMSLREDFDYFRIEIDAPEGATGLVIRTPSGGYLCAAPDDGPVRIERDAWAAGRYRLWVASRARDETPDYRIIYSETRAPEE